MAVYIFGIDYSGIVGLRIAHGYDSVGGAKRGNAYFIRSWFGTPSGNHIDEPVGGDGFFGFGGTPNRLVLGEFSVEFCCCGVYLAVLSVFFPSFSRSMDTEQVDSSGSELCGGYIGGIAGSTVGDYAAYDVLFRAVFELFSVDKLAGDSVGVACGSGSSGVVDNRTHTDGWGCSGTSGVRTDLVAQS